MKVLSCLLFLSLVLGCTNSSGNLTNFGLAGEFFSVYGELVDISENFTLLKIQSTFVNYESNNSFLEINSVYNPLVNLTKGNNYVFTFARDNKSMPWSLNILSENLIKYKQNGFDAHDNDLSVNQLINSVNMGSVSQIISSIINKDELSNITSSLVNHQDVNINYSISDLLLSNLVGDCVVSLNDANSSIPANSTKLLNFVVNCSNNVELSNMTSGGVNNNLELVGTLEFVDELENLHVFSNKVFKQFIEIK